MRARTVVAMVVASPARSRNGGTCSVDAERSASRSERKWPFLASRPRSARVVATQRTSTGLSSLGWAGAVPRACVNIAWASFGNSSMARRKSVPPAAAAAKLQADGTVGSPLPNNSAATVSAGTAAQSSEISRPRRCLCAACRAWATRVLPVPDSPRTSTGPSLSPKAWIALKSSRIGGLSPRMLAKSRLRGKLGGAASPMPSRTALAKAPLSSGLGR